MKQPAVHHIPPGGPGADEGQNQGQVADASILKVWKFPAMLVAVIARIPFWTWVCEMFGERTSRLLVILSSIPGHLLKRPDAGNSLGHGGPQRQAVKCPPRAPSALTRDGKKIAAEACCG